MAQSLFTLTRQAFRGRSHLFALAGASTAAYFGLAEKQQQPAALPRTRFTLPGCIPVALADAMPETESRKASPAASIALTGFEDVKDANSFVSSALAKTLQHRKDSPLQPLLSKGSSPASPQSFGEAPAPSPLQPAAFYDLLERQPLNEKVIILDDIVDSVIHEAERSAEVSGLTVGMVGGGVACYALLGWWTDLALPGAGTVACSAVAGAAGHNRAKAAAQRTRGRFLNAVLSSAPPGGRNSFVSYLAAPTSAEKRAIASDVRPAAFFADFYAAVAPLLKQVSVVDTAEAVLSTAA